MATWSDRINEIISKLETAALTEAEARVARQAPAAALPQQPMPVERPQKKANQPGRAKVARPTAPAPALPQIQAAKMMQGVIFAEILGPPLARRRGRGRHSF